MKHEYTITGMHCGSCVAKIQQALAGIDGVTHADVTLEPPVAEVEMARHVPLDDINQAVAKQGDYRLAKADAGADESPASQADGGQASEESPESLYPLFLIVGYIAGAVVLVAWSKGAWTLSEMMRHFMAGFFLVFSFFKLLDLRGFVSTYRGYDLLARRSTAYAWAYPFIELGLGVAYLLNMHPVVTNVVTLLVMLVGAVGVLLVLLDKRSIRCACLGTALNLPMTKVTLVEDLTMAAMAAGMLVQLLLLQG